MDILYIASVSVISPEPAESRRLFMDALGLPLQPASPGDEYHFSEQIGGCKHFGVWPLTQAAQACFGAAEWPPDRPVPQVSIEFEVADADAIGQAAHELETRGYTLLHGSRHRTVGPDGRASANRGWGDRRDFVRALGAPGSGTGLTYQKARGPSSE